MSALPDLAADPRTLLVCKNPEPVAVAFAPEAGACETLEGPVRYRAGDAILTGIRGECWPVRRDLFLVSYEAVSPTVAGKDGLYRKIPSVARALRLELALDVPVGWQDDPLRGRPGDWVLQYADGTNGVVQDAIFRASYGPAPDETRWPPP
jgi:hypothetical protein